MNRYNIYLKTQSKTENILDISDDDLNKIVESYNIGKQHFFINGQKYWLSNLFEIQIFSFEHEEIKTKEQLLEIAKIKNLFKKSMLDTYLPKEVLVKFGKNLTSDFIKDDYGSLSELDTMKITDLYVSTERITEISKIENPDFDFTKLIAMLKELNLAYQNEMTLTISFLIRAIKDHVPPIFNEPDFNSVANSRTKSVKANFLNLQQSLKNIADANIHQPIRKKESLPNLTQVNFKNDLDVLLQEIVRISKI